MSIRRVGKADKVVTRPVSTGNSRVGKAQSGEEFAQQLAQVTGAHSPESVERVSVARAVGSLSDQTGSSSQQRHEQLDQTEDLLDTLEALGQGLDHALQVNNTNEDLTRQRLKETRDHALRTLSGTSTHSRERDLLHRTALLATVELAKSERGDYN